MARFEDICKSLSAAISSITDTTPYKSLVLFNIDLIAKYDLFPIQHHPLNQVVA
jgi:hypothetical protein